MYLHSLKGGSLSWQEIEKFNAKRHVYIDTNLNIMVWFCVLL